MSIPSKNLSEVLFLGSGTSKGVPEIACACDTCRSADVRDKRLRSSVLLRSSDGGAMLIDCGPDFRQQMLTHDVRHLDAVLITHEHYDHVAGLDDLRPFGNMGLYAQKRVLEAIERNMPYSFTMQEKKFSVPELMLNEIGANPFDVAGWQVTPIRLLHYKLPVLGFRIDNFAYLTDFNDIIPEDVHKLKGLDVVAVDALRQRPHLSHNSLQQALSFIELLEPKQAYLTHIAHDMGKHADVQKQLPANVSLAYDGLNILF